MLLQVEKLSVAFDAEAGPALAVDGVSFFLETGQTLCLVGESGCGKSVTALALLRLLPEPPARIAGGRVLFDGRDLASLSEDEMRAVRGRQIGMVFQEPMTSLNPVFKVGEQIAESLRLHLKLSRADAAEKAVDLLREVGIADPRARAGDFPHQLSGGMRQRVMIAMALACQPKLLIADEPTTALDVSVQGQILRLMRDLTKSRGSALLLITHDLGVVAQAADQVAVMYSGKIVENAPVRELFNNPAHPYTQGLMRARPRLGPARCADSGQETCAPAREARLYAIPGTVPGPLERPLGCAFQARCPKVFDLCRREMPPLIPVGADHASRCWLNDGRLEQA